MNTHRLFRECAHAHHAYCRYVEHGPTGWAFCTCRCHTTSRGAANRDHSAVSNALGSESQAAAEAGPLLAGNRESGGEKGNVQKMHIASADVEGVSAAPKPNPACTATDCDCPAFEDDLAVDHDAPGCVCGHVWRDHPAEVEAHRPVLRPEWVAEDAAYEARGRRYLREHSRTVNEQQARNAKCLRCRKQHPRYRHPGDGACAVAACECYEYYPRQTIITPRPAAIDARPEPRAWPAVAPPPPIQHQEEAER